MVACGQWFVTMNGSLGDVNVGVYPADFWDISSGFALLGLSCEVWVCGSRAGG